MLDIEDTIVAIASPASPARRGIVRVSGTRVIEFVQHLGLKANPARSLAYDLQFDAGPPLGYIPTRALVWPTNKSYTGQPAAEIHTYGAVPILNALVDKFISLGARAARPGEFTMRAFLAGRLDLTQAEAVLGVIDAQHRGSLDHALRQLAGNLSRPLEEMRGDMLNLLADVEAGLDFVDEDIEFISDKVLIERLTNIANQLKVTSSQLQNRGDSRAAVAIALRGEPNAGKSQLLNALVGHEAAIVADVAGTTRDVVFADSKLGDHDVTYIDTAGIEEATSNDELGQITTQSQDHAIQASESAAIRLWCIDASRSDFTTATNALNKIALADKRQSAIDVWVCTKSDLVTSDAATTSQPEGEMNGGVPADSNDTITQRTWHCTSSKTGTGVSELQQHLRTILDARDAEETGSVIGTAARCRGSLSSAIQAIQVAVEMTQTQAGHEFVSAELRSAVQHLGEVTGAVYTDDILDRVFSRFCIGK